MLRLHAPAGSFTLLSFDRATSLQRVAEAVDVYQVRD